MDSKNRRQKKQFMTHDKNKVYFPSEILEVVEQTECQNGKFKTTFKVNHPSKDEPLTCILWERSCMRAGDKVYLTGVFKDNAFIAYSAMVNRYGNISNST